MSKHYKGENGVSMNIHYITKEMRKKASDGIYRVSKEELKEIKEHNKQVKIQKELEKQDRERIRLTSYELLSKALNTPINKKIILRCEKYRNLGSGSYAIKCIDKDKMIISMKKQPRGIAYKYQIVK